MSNEIDRLKDELKASKVGLDQLGKLSRDLNEMVRIKAAENERLGRQNAALREALEDCERVLRLSPRFRNWGMEKWDAAIRKAQAALSTETEGA